MHYFNIRVELMSLSNNYLLFFAVCPISYKLFFLNLFATHNVNKKHYIIIILKSSYYSYSKLNAP